MKFLLNDALPMAFIATSATFLGAEVKSLLAALPAEVPSFLVAIAGPIGSFICMAVAINWLLKRLAKKEAVETVRQDRQDAMLVQMAESNLRVALALEKNSDALDRNSKYLEEKDTK